jgi:hypothetical protein
MVSKTWILNTPRHFFWYTTCIPYHSFALHFCTWWPSPTKMTVKTYSFQDLSYDIRHAYLLRTLDFYTWWLRPTPSMGSKTLFFFNFGTYSSRPFFFYIRHACLWIFVFDEPTPPRGPKNMKIETYSSIPFIWYATCLPSKNFGFLYLMTPPHSLEWVLQQEFWNVLVETFHLIYDMPTLT